MYLLEISVLEPADWIVIPTGAKTAIARTPYRFIVSILFSRKASMSV